MNKTDKKNFSIAVMIGLLMAFIGVPSIYLVGFYFNLFTDLYDIALFVNRYAYILMLIIVLIFHFGLLRMYKREKVRYQAEYQGESDEKITSKIQSVDAYITMMMVLSFIIWSLVEVLQVNFLDVELLEDTVFYSYITFKLLVIYLLLSLSVLQTKYFNFLGIVDGRYCGSPMEFNYEMKFYKSRDEGEKLKIANAAFISNYYTKITLFGSLFISMVTASAFGTGVYPVILTGTILVMQQVIYYKNLIK